MSLDDIDDDLFGEDDPTPVPDGGKQKNPLAEQRRRIKELENRLKEVEPEYETLKAFKVDYETEKRETTIKDVVKELELPENVVKFFKLENPEGEVTKEVVAKWAVDNSFATAEQFTGTESGATGFVPTTHGEAFIPGAKTYTREEFEKALRGTPAEALAAQDALQKGRVDMIRAT